MALTCGKAHTHQEPHFCEKPFGSRGTGKCFRHVSRQRCSRQGAPFCLDHSCQKGSPGCILLIGHDGDCIFYANSQTRKAITAQKMEIVR